MKKIILKSNKNLEAKLWFPKNAKKGIVIAHSFRSTFEQPICIEAAEIFYKEGYAVLAFNFLGHGKSEGALREVSYKTISENVASAIKYLKKKNLSKIGVYALSLGAIATVLSKEQPDSQFFISPSPLYDSKGLLERYSEFVDFQEEEIKNRGYAIITSKTGRGNFEMGKEWINEMREDKGEIQEKYLTNGISTMIVQGTEDDLKRQSQAKKFMISTKSKCFYLPGDHEFTNFDQRKNVIELALNWFKQNL